MLGVEGIKTVLINEVLHDVRVRSFFMVGDLFCEFLIFFKLCVSGWVSLTVSEGVSKFFKAGFRSGIAEAV